MATTGLSRTSWFTTERLALAGLLLLTLVIRGGVLWALRPNLEQDPDAYRRIAENLGAHGVFSMGEPYDQFPVPTAYRPPLYPVVLSNLMVPGRQISPLSVASLHVLLGVATVWLTWLMARRMVGPSRRDGPAAENICDPVSASSGKSTPAAGQVAQSLSDLLLPLLAGLFVACDPLLVYWQTYVMTETLAALLAILCLWCLTRYEARRDWFNAALAGGAIGLAVLCRPTFLPWLALVGLAILVVWGRKFEFRILNSELQSAAWRMANAAALVIAAGIVMSPWAIHNYRVFGKPIMTTTHGGYTLLLGNNEHFYRWLAATDHSVPWQSRSLDAEIERWWMLQSILTKETDHDQLYYARAREVISEHPRAFALACAYRLRQLWSLLPHRLTADESMGKRLMRYGTCGWYLGVYALAAVGVWRLRWKLLQPPWIWGVLMCVAFTAVHTFYWTNMRMRAPLMPFVAIVAAAAASSRFKVPSSKLAGE